MHTSKITIKSLFGISEQEIGGKSVEITGRKGAGKTSVIDAIRYALTNSSSRDWIIKNGETVSLDSVARTIGLTKAGLVHHFPTKKALMIGLIENVAEKWRTMLEEAPSKNSPEERMMTYLNYALSDEIDSSDFAFMADYKLKDELYKKWAELIDAWFNFNDIEDSNRKSALTTVRLIADGAWFDRGLSMLTINNTERQSIILYSEEILNKGVSK